MNLISILDLSKPAIREIWARAGQPPCAVKGTVACSFEGNGIRTRTAFIQAFQQLGLAYVELPNLLKSNERVSDLAGYLDPLYEMYVVRESHHERLREFARASKRPVVNAMSCEGHPCEVLCDAYYIDSQLGSLETTRIGLWGPPTNVFQSWYELAAVYGIRIYHFCGPQFHRENEHVRFRSRPDDTVDILITDGWPGEFQDAAWSLTRDHLLRLGNPRLMPTPPFSIGRELGFDPLGFEGFVGYEQKRLLLPVQRAIVGMAFQ